MLLCVATRIHARNLMSKNKRIPVVDIFAGPGGLGEGFARYPYSQKNSPQFQIQLSIEKDERAHQTLMLRSFRRQFAESCVPNDYYSLLKDVDRPLSDRLAELYNAYPDEFEHAQQEAICAELGNPDFKKVVEDSLNKAVGNERDWVLVGGPPCQAYSLAGRSRNKGNADYRPSKDNRQFLYREYLKVIADHLPSVFVMENVKGLLSATMKNKKIFDQIVSDLENPCKALGYSTRKRKGVATTYRLFSVLHPECFDGKTNLSDFVIRMEEHGIPQKRHRLIILGVRDDLGIGTLPKTLQAQSEIDLSCVLDDLPRLRSGLSKSKDSEANWKREVALSVKSKWFKDLNNGRTKLKSRIKNSVANLGEFEFERGNDWVGKVTKANYLPKWFHDARIKGVLNHQTRGHISDDLHRYLYAACFAKENIASPVLKDFPKELWPKHKNVKAALNGSLFADRFRVQRFDRPSTTITCHISKDGHYYIHPDPTQCRSLTVREAARLQTFPDNYFFCGPRTLQYVQVGNAVPPFLAHQVAEVVYALFKTH